MLRRYIEGVMYISPIIRKNTNIKNIWKLLNSVRDIINNSWVDVKQNVESKYKDE